MRTGELELDERQEEWERTELEATPSVDRRRRASQLAL